jgi:hypothetical protein
MPLAGRAELVAGVDDDACLVQQRLGDPLISHQPVADLGEQVRRACSRLHADARDPAQRGDREVPEPLVVADPLGDEGMVVAQP